MSDQDFVHLHVHTEYSLLDGLSKIKKLVARANELNMQALAITDHGTMFGVIDFYRACKGAGIKPILGVESYLARRTMHDRDPKLDSKPYHLLLLAENETGYKNLLQIVSEAQLRGYYYKPRTDQGFLRDHAAGIITTTGCLAGYVPSLIIEGQTERARELIHEYIDVFGRDNFYLELQQHNIPELKLVNDWLIETAARDNLQLLATNDVHYVLEEDFDSHDTLLCIQTGSVKNDTNRMMMTDNSYFLANQAQMWQTFGHIQDGAPLLNSLKIAEMCNLNLDDKQYKLPIFPVPEGYTPETYLRYLAEKGLVWRFPHNHDEAIYRERIDREINIIIKMGFPTYFLIVWDLLQFARHADIWWNVRGSGAGSLVAYCLGITNIDPIQNNLLFERFLNPGRVSMPDIDIDFPDDRRSEMISYCSRKYGEDKVAAIITFGTMGAKAAVRDVGRALNVPLELVNQAAKLIPTEPKPKPVMEYVTDNPDLLKMYNTMPEIKRIIDTAEKLQGVTRHASTHAAGVIVADRPLVEYLPLHRLTSESKSGEEDSPIKQVTQFPMETCESIGLLKVDFLGLSTLTQLRLTCELIERYHGTRYDMSNIPYRPGSDARQNQMLEEAFRMIGRGESIGVFQIESTGMQEMLRGMRPSKFEHIVAAVSLYRPGPMDYIPEFNDRMHGVKEVHYHHPKLKSILEETYGIIVYQEQLMQVASELFGYSLGDADLMRRAVSKKKKEDLLKHKEIFLKNGPANGVDEEAAGKIFDDIEFFANYGFNKCVIGSTLIIDADTGQRVQIGDLATGKAQVKRTLTLDPESQRIISGEISHVHENGVRPVYKLTTQLGRTITATNNHPFLTRDGWCELGDLAVGGVIAVPARLPTTPRAKATRLQKIKRKKGAIRSRFASEAPSVGFNCDSRRALALGVREVTYICLPAARRDDSGLLSPEGEGLGVRASSDIYWDSIVAIEYAGEEMTYDLTVPGTHNFIANDIIVHNSHAADYAVITVQSAYLKCHYPEEYMTSLLTVYFDDSDKVTTFLAECKRLNIPILPPDVNSSEQNFTIQQQADGRRGIRFGLAAVKNAGIGAIQHILDARAKGGIFRDLADFCERVDLRAVGKRTVESLIKVGALEAFGERGTLFAALDRIMSFSGERHKAREVGQMSMFGGGDDSAQNTLLDNLPKIAETEREQLNWEKELLGFYVSRHPIDPVLSIIQGSNFDTTRSLKQAQPDVKERPVKIIGLVAELRKMPTKNKDMMAVIKLEDHFSTIDVVFFPRLWKKWEDQIHEGAVLQFVGRLDLTRGEPQIIGEAVTDSFEAVMADDADVPEKYRKENLAWVSDAEAAYVAPAPDWMPPSSAGDDEAFFSTPGEYLPNGQNSAPPPPNMDSLPLAPRDPDALPWLNGDGSDAVDVPLEPLPEADDAAPIQRRLLIVQFPRSGDGEKDVKLFNRLIRIITSYPGQDAFAMRIGEQVIEYPDEPIGICDAMLRELHKRVGADHVGIVEL